jgi:hypothetical protein
MPKATTKTFTAQIYMAGDIAHAKQIIRSYVLDIGLCVTIEPVDFIYTGGEEAGFRVGLINYPRFPAMDEEVFEKAVALADKLRDALAQNSYSIVTPSLTYWDTRRTAE